jgi:hypothetical protein
MQHIDKYTCNICLKNKWNIGNRHLQHTCISFATYATSWANFATSVWITCNIHVKHLKHLNIRLLYVLWSTTSTCYLDEIEAHRRGAWCYGVAQGCQQTGGCAATAIGWVSGCSPPRWRWQRRAAAPSAASAPALEKVSGAVESSAEAR